MSGDAESVARGDEKMLGWELLDALAGRAPRSAAWKKGDGPPTAALGPGSNNIPLLRKLVQLMREGAAKWAPWWLEWFRLSEQTWMGRELLSRIYRTWHLIAVLGVRAWAVDHGHAQLLHAADRWLACWWAAMRAIRAPDGALAPVGWRANDHPGPDGQLEGGPDLATEIALYIGAHSETLVSLGALIAADCDAILRDATHDGILADRQRWARPVEAATRRIVGSAPTTLRTLLERCDRASWATWERVALYRLARHLRDTATAARLAPSDEAALDSWTPGVRTLFPVEVGFGPGYRVVAISRNGNNNTPPILCSWWQAGDWRTLPPEEILRHIRQTTDHSTASRDGRTITVTSTIYEGGPWRHTVPAGTRFRTLDRPGPGEPPVEPPQPPEPPTEPEPPQPPTNPGTPRRRDRDSARTVLVCLAGAALLALIGHLQGCW